MKRGFVAGQAEQQVPPLRFAPVGMTILLQNGRHRVRFSTSNEFVISTGAYPDLLLRGTHPRLRVRLSVKSAT
jgi:hypothetical protein